MEHHYIYPVYYDQKGYQGVPGCTLKNEGKKNTEHMVRVRAQKNETKWLRMFYTSNLLIVMGLPTMRETGGNGRTVRGALPVGCQSERNKIEA